MRTVFFCVFLLLGIGVFVGAVFLELHIREEVGQGLHKKLAYAFYDDDIKESKNIVFFASLLGLPLLCLAYACRPRRRQ